MMEWLTEEGKKVLKKRLESMIKIYNMDDVVYPAALVVLDIGTMHIESRELLKERIKELATITQSKVVDEVIIEKDNKGNEIKKEILR